MTRAVSVSYYIRERTSEIERSLVFESKVFYFNFSKNIAKI